MVFMFDKVHWFNDILRDFFGGIDLLVYSLLSWIMSGVFELTDLLANPLLVEFLYRRIYIVLSIFMIFKLSFSFIQYLVSPDAMADKERGVGKLIMRTVVMLCLIVFLPIFFFETPLRIGEKDHTVLSALQTGVLRTLPNVILGSKSDDVDVEAYGEAISVIALRTLYYPVACKNENSSECKELISQDKHEIKNFNDFEKYLKEDDGDKIYDYYYMWPLTTVAGIFLVVTLLGIAIDVAIRTFKLILLQMIAPIPVMSFIDPKASKEGGSFSSWIKLFTSTYIDVFIKIAVLYIVILLISQMFETGGLFSAGNDINSISKGGVKTFVIIFLLIGLFKFAKEAPKFLKQALGLKDSGGGIFDNLKTIGAAAGFAGGALAGAATGVAGGIGAARATYKNAGDSKGKKLAAVLGGLGSAVSGGVAGTVRGGYRGGINSKNGNFLNGMSNAISNQASLNKKKVDAARAGSTGFGRAMTRLDEMFTGSNAYERQEKALSDYKNAISAADDFKNTLSSAAAKSDDMLNVAGFGKGLNLKQFQGTLAAARAGDKSALNDLKKYGFSNLSAAESGAAAFEKAYNKAYYDNIFATAPNKLDADQSAVLSSKAVADSVLSSLDLTDSTGAKIDSISAYNMGTVKGVATSASNAIRSSDSYKKNKANAEAVKKSGK